MTSDPSCSIYVLRVPEFDAIVRGLEALDGVSVTERGDYYEARAAGDIELHRSDVGVEQAVWFGALTGGVTGEIAEFGPETLRIVPLSAAG